MNVSARQPAVRLQSSENVRSASISMAKFPKEAGLLDKVFLVNEGISEKATVVLDGRNHGMEGVRFYTRTRGITTRWPHQDLSEGIHL